VRLPAPRLLPPCRCLCRECAVHLKESNVQACPMCRETVQAYIMRVF
jgi:hypothetical protein